MKHKLWMMGTLLAAALLLVSCAQELNWSPNTCTQDSDCVPSACCHANESVNIESAPNCIGQFCTSECVPNTLDCGQGNLQCISGKCQIVITKPIIE